MPTHPFVPHLWKKGVCRECGETEVLHGLATLPAAAAAVSSPSSIPPPLPKPAVIPAAASAITPPPIPVTATGAMPPPLPSTVNASTASTSAPTFRKPALSNSQSGPLGRVGAIPPPLPPTVPNMPLSPKSAALVEALSMAVIDLSNTDGANKSTVSSAAPPVASSSVPPPRPIPTVTPTPLPQQSVTSPSPSSTSIPLPVNPPPKTPSPTSSSRPLPPTRKPAPPPSRPPPAVPPPLPKAASSTTITTAPAAAPVSVVLPPPLPATVVTSPKLPPPLPSAVSPSPLQLTTPPPLPPSVAASPKNNTAAATGVAHIAPPSLRIASPALTETISTPSTATAAGAAAARAASPNTTDSANPTISSLLSTRTVATRLVDYFAIFGHGSLVLDESFSPTNALSSLRFHSQLLCGQRVPAQDWKDSTFSGNTSSFCFPNYASLKLVPLKDVNDTYSVTFLERRPTLHRFVLTKLDGSKQYCVTLICWQRKGNEEIELLLQEMEKAVCGRFIQIGTPIEASQTAASVFVRNLRSQLTNVNNPATIFEPRALTIVSSWPFFTLFEEFLRNIYRVSTSGLTESNLKKQAEKLQKALGNINSNTYGELDYDLVKLPLPLERIISNFLFEIPLPSPGLVQVRYPLPGSSRNTGPALIITRPPINQLPLCDVDWLLLFRALDHETFIGIFVAVATEQKVLLVSRYRNLISAVCDAISILLFPFQWAGVFMPLLPEPMSEFLFAPVPFLAGIHSSHYLKKLDEIPDDIIIVELDDSRIRLPDENTLPQLPESMYSKLLQSLKAHANITQKQHPLVGMSDQAFPFGQDLFKMEVGNICEERASAAPGTTATNSVESVSPTATNAPASPPPAPIVPVEYQALSTAFEPQQTYLPIQKPSSLQTQNSKEALEAAAVPVAAPDEASLHIEEVRYAFLRMWCKLMARHSKYMPWAEHAVSSSTAAGESRGRAASPGRGPSARSVSPGSGRNSPTSVEPNEIGWFNTTGFIDDSPRDARPFLTQFCASQMFAKFIDDRITMHGDVQAWLEKKKASSAEQQRNNKLGVMSDNEDGDSDSDNEHMSSTINEDEAMEDFESTQISQGNSRYLSSQHKKQYSSSGVSTSALSTPSHSRQSSGLPADILSSISSEVVVPAAVGSTVPPPSFLSNQIDSIDPTQMPILHQIVFFHECILAKKNRRRQKLIGSIASGRLWNKDKAPFHLTPFLHDTSTSAENVYHTLLPDNSDLDQPVYGYPKVKNTTFTAAGGEVKTAVYPVFPELEYSLLGSPRPIPNLAAPPSVAVTPLMSQVVPIIAVETPVVPAAVVIPPPMRATPIPPPPVAASTPIPPPISIVTPSSPTGPRPFNPRLPPPGRNGMVLAPSVMQNVQLRSVSRAERALSPTNRERTPSPVSPRSPHVRAGMSAPNYVVATPANARIIPGQRGSFIGFRARNPGGVQSKINQLASLLSFEPFQNEENNNNNKRSSIISPNTAAALLGKDPVRPVGGVPLSALPISTLPPASNTSGNKKLQSLMEKEREKQEKEQAKKKAKLQQKKEKSEKAEKAAEKEKYQDKSSKKSPVLYHPPVYSTSSRPARVAHTVNTAVRPASSAAAVGGGSDGTTSAPGSAKASDRTTAPRRFVGSSIFSFAPILGGGSKSDKDSQKVGKSISSPVLVSAPISSAPIGAAIAGNWSLAASGGVVAVSTNTRPGPPPPPTTAAIVATPPPVPTTTNVISTPPPPATSSSTFTRPLPYSAVVASSSPLVVPPPLPTGFLTNLPPPLSNNVPPASISNQAYPAHGSGNGTDSELEWIAATGRKGRRESRHSISRRRSSMIGLTTHHTAVSPFPGNTRSPPPITSALVDLSSSTPMPVRTLVVPANPPPPLASKNQLSSPPNVPLPTTPPAAIAAREAAAAAASAQSSSSDFTHSHSHSWSEVAGAISSSSLLSPSAVAVAPNTSLQPSQRHQRPTRPAPKPPTS